MSHTLGRHSFIERDVFKGDIMIVTSNFSTVISLIRGFHSSGCDYYFSA
jgi:hypothetical protein